MSVLLDFDTEKIMKAKLEKVKKKYPAQLMKSRNGKDTEVQKEYWKIKKQHRMKGI